MLGPIDVHIEYCLILSQSFELITQYLIKNCKYCCNFTSRGAPEDNDSGTIMAELQALARKITNVGREVDLELKYITLS